MLIGVEIKIKTSLEWWSQLSFVAQDDENRKEQQAQQVWMRLLWEEMAVVFQWYIMMNNTHAMRTCIHACTHKHAHTHTHMHAHTHTHTHTHTCIHTDTYTHTHTHRYMHTHTHTHRHTHIHTHRVKNPYPRQYYGTKYSGRYCLQTKVVKSTSKTTRTCTAVLSNWIIFWGVLRVEGNLYCLLIVGEIALHYIPCHTKLKHFTYNTHTTALKTHLQCSGQT